MYFLKDIIYFENKFLKEKCNQNIAKMALKHSPSLFQHIGEHSSLRGKIQHLVDNNFRDRLIYENHTNPNADLTSSLKTYQDYSLDSCYKKGKHYWTFNPNENDYINFKFKEPFLLKMLDFYYIDWLFF